MKPTRQTQEELEDNCYGCSCFKNYHAISHISSLLLLISIIVHIVLVATKSMYLDEDSELAQSSTCQSTVAAYQKGLIFVAILFAICIYLNTAGVMQNRPTYIKSSGITIMGAGSLLLLEMLVLTSQNFFNCVPVAGKLSISLGVLYISLGIIVAVAGRKMKKIVQHHLNEVYTDQTDTA